MREVGAFREGYDGSQDHDLALRVSERARRVVHVDRVLYHWRAVAGSAAADINAKPYADDAGQRAVQDQLDRLGIAGTVGPGREPGRYVIERRLDPALLVSIVIPTIGQSATVFGERRVMVARHRADRARAHRPRHVEFVVVHDTPDAARGARGAARARGRPADARRVRRSPSTSPQKMNLGCLHASGDRLVFLNDDVEVLSAALAGEPRRPARRAGRGPHRGQALLQRRVDPARRATATGTSTTTTRSATGRATRPGRSVSSRSTAR